MLENKVLKMLCENLKLNVDYDKNKKVIKVSMSYKGHEVAVGSTEIGVDK